MYRDGRRTGQDSVLPNWHYMGLRVDYPASPAGTVCVAGLQEQLPEGLPKKMCPGQALASPLEGSLVLGIRVSAPTQVHPPAVHPAVLAPGSTWPAHSRVAYEARSSPAAFHVVHCLLDSLCQAVGRAAALLPPLCSLSPTLVGTGQWMPVSLVGDPCLYE